MLFLLILNFCLAILTSGQVWPLYSTPRKTVTLSSIRGQVFREEGVWNYSTMLLREDLGVLMLGAKDTFFALDLMDITNKKAVVEWAATENEQILCSYKGQSLAQCQNYIQVLNKMPDGRMYVCGTNAFNPTCDYLSYTDGNLTLHNQQHSGKGRCPYNPYFRVASEFVDGELYSATFANFLGTEPVVIRNTNYIVRTEYTKSWLNDPSFIGLIHIPEGTNSPEGDDDKIYIFFTETAVEYDSYKETRVTRVARVCKGDKGGKFILTKKWTSYLKAQLDCKVPHNTLPLLMQDVFLFCPGNWTTCVFYGVFTPQTYDPGNAPQYSAVCVYHLEDIRKVFSEGQFKTHFTDTTMWVFKWVVYTGPMPDVRPGECINKAARGKGISTTYDLPDKTLQFVRDKPLMDQGVQQPSKFPLLLNRGAGFTRIVVANTTALDGSCHQVMFIGTESGSVLKAVNYDGQMVIIEEVQLFNPTAPVNNMRLSTTLGQLYVGSSVGVAQMPLSTCDQYTSCFDCVLARDPYCGWDLTSDRCIAINDTQPDTHSKIFQNLTSGGASRCPAVAGSTTVITVYHGNLVRLPCQPASKLAYMQWSVKNHTIENSNKYQLNHNSLLILDTSDSDAGFYICTSVESSNGEDYVTQKAIYDLRLRNFMDHPSVQSHVQGQQKIQLALIALVVILTLVLIVLVWNLCKGNGTILWCSGQVDKSPQSVFVNQEPTQSVNINEVGNNNQHEGTVASRLTPPGPGFDSGKWKVSV